MPLVNVAGPGSRLYLPSGGGSSGAFFDDPYSGYSQLRLVDPSLSASADTVGGSSQIRTWDGAGGTYACYKTPDYAIRDGAGGGKRIGFLKSTTSRLTTNNPFTTGGSSANALFMLQGDPSATDAEMPIIEENNGSGTSFAFIFDSANYVGVRKLRIRNQDDPGVGIRAGALYFDTCIGPVVEFCDIYGGIQPSGAKDCGCVTLVDSSNPIVRYNKFHDVTITGGTYNGNNSGIMITRTPGGVAHHNEIYRIGNGIFMKFPTSGTGWLVYCNKIYEAQGVAGGICLALGNAGVTAASSGHEYYKNLCYNSPNFLVAYQNNLANQAGTIKVYSNTVAEDVAQGAEYGGYNDIQGHSNVMLCSGSGGFSQLRLDNPGSIFDLVTEWDYNHYYGVKSWKLDSTTYSTFANWKAATHAYLNSGLNQDAHGSEMAGGTLGTNFVDTASRDYTIKAGSALLTAGKGGINPGYDSTDIGPGW